MIRTILTAILLIVGSQSPSTAGKLTFSHVNPDWALFTGAITIDEIDAILATLNERKPKLLGLASQGGNVGAASRLASHVRENEINTFVTNQASCTSACALVFLAGRERLCEGRLGVHQIRPLRNIELNEKVVWFVVQNALAKTLALLNSFDTPPFVFERILNNFEMYYFSEVELAQLNTVNHLHEMWADRSD